MTERPIGLVAGWGRFPVRFAEAAKAQGYKVATVGLTGLADPCLERMSDHFGWCGVAKIGRAIRILKRGGAERWVMAGKVMKDELLKPGRLFSLLPDLRTLRFWYSRTRRDNRDDSLLLGLIGEFARDGLVCESALDYCPELLVKPGVLTKRRPSAAEERDIQFGWELAKEMGRLDVGQSVAVRERAVLAVEAIEGTDRAIRRAGELCRRGGFVVVKVAKPQQDRRFDVPTVGTSTIESMREAGAKVLAVEAGQTIFLDEGETVAAADRYGISIVAR